MTPPELEALSPVDGRYAAQLPGLHALCSEAGLIRQRVRIEAMWWQRLFADARVPALQGVSAAVQAEAQSLAADPAQDLRPD